jgi:hypothetical protein
MNFTNHLKQKDTKHCILSRFLLSNQSRKLGEFTTALKSENEPQQQEEWEVGAEAEPVPTCAR